MAVDRILVTDYSSAIKTTANTARVDLKSGRIISTETNSTIALWVNLIGAGGGNGYTMYCERAATGNNIFKFQVSTARKLVFTHRNDGGTLDQPTSTSSLANGRWYHVAVVKQGTGITFYIDGVANGTGTLVGNDTLTNSSTLTTLAYDIADTASGWLNGMMDKVQIYNTNLSASQINDLYLYGSTSVAPIGRWLMDEGSGSTIADSGTASNNGTLTSVTFSTDVAIKTRSAATRP